MVRKVASSSHFYQLPGARCGKVNQTSDPFHGNDITSLEPEDARYCIRKSTDYKIFLHDLIVHAIRLHVGTHSM
jgi:hypothetical protein